MSAHQLEENQTTTLANGVEVTRVPGDWIYYFIFRKTSTFVPYSKEFDEEGERAERLKQLLEMQQMQSQIPPPPTSQFPYIDWSIGGILK